WAPHALIFFIALVLYANTLGHDFTQDDAIVIYDNIYVTKGVEGLSDIFTKDSFSGFFGGENKSGLVSGGRYRPMTLAVFAVLYEFAGANPSIYHFVNIGAYATLCLLIFVTLKEINRFWPEQDTLVFAFLSSLIFVVHPVHTEVVANVKGLDEIFSLFFSILTLLCAVRYVRSTGIWWLLLSVISFFVALLSKENAVVFVLLVPVVLYYFTKSKYRKQAYISSGMLVLSFGVYWIIRSQIIGSSFGDPPTEMMNNPFMKVVDGQYYPFSLEEKWASITFGMGKYIQLLFFPHPLTHDYYPRHFEVLNFKNLGVIAAAIMNITLVLIAILGIRRKSFISFCIFFFYATIALMANIFFPIGTHLSERFLFTPSLALSMTLAFGLIHQCKSNGVKMRMLALLGGIVFLGSVKTVTRNTVWKNDFTLFTTDVQTSKRSAKVRNAAGGALITAALEPDNADRKESMMEEAVLHLNEAVKIHPRYKEAYLLLGNAHSYLKEFDNSIRSYEMALSINPYYETAESNLMIVLREGAKLQGGQNRNYIKAIQYLERALELSPNDFEATALLGTAYGSAGDHRNAIKYFTKAISINPDIATTYVNLGFAQLNLGMEEEAQINFSRAVQIDPKAVEQIQNQ
ncbi:MAG: tetratricopeptide repeat protein, partial [Saprospiraceae bacterium]|nr:tetratricopeptide repeat protein [Saprospiraceae bacterium]